MRKQQFGIGLRLGTYSVTILENSLNKGDSFDVSFIDFQNIDSTTFDILFNDLTNQYTTKDIHHAIKMDGLIIDVLWRNDRIDYSDQIKISCCQQFMIFPHGCKPFHVKLDLKCFLVNYSFTKNIDMLECYVKYPDKEVTFQ